jgi:hypothetical protein
MKPKGGEWFITLGNYAKNSVTAGEPPPANYRDEQFNKNDNDADRDNELLRSRVVVEWTARQFE